MILTIIVVKINLRALNLIFLKMIIRISRNNHIVALAAAAFVHGALATWALLPSGPVIISQQAIKVSFVAPSASAKKSSSTTKMVKEVKSENALMQKKVHKIEQAQLNEEKNQKAGQQTSGHEDQKATATVAADSEPVFNAAYLNNPAPYYPQNAKRKGIQGKVLLSVIVKTDGSAGAIQISKSSGSNDLDEAALDAVKQWKFIPAKNKGQLVQASVIVPVEFKLI